MYSFCVFQFKYPVGCQIATEHVIVSVKAFCKFTIYKHWRISRICFFRQFVGAATQYRKA